MRAIGTLLSIVWVSTLVSPALAGEGQLVEDATGAKLHALQLNYQFRFPPTAAEIEGVKEQLQLASSVLCDATDGQLYIEQVTLNAGGPNDEKADIAHYPHDARAGVAGVQGKGNLGIAGSHIDVYGIGVRGSMLAHELGHYTFGMLDQYDEQRRHGGPCGIGRSFDPGAMTDTAGSRFVEDEINHSMMQRSSGMHQCAKPDPSSPNKLLGMGTPCASMADCTVAGETCEVVLGSELSVSLNTDPLRGDAMSCADAATNGVYSPCCGSQLATTTLVLQGRLNATLPTVASSAAPGFDPSDFATAKATAASTVEGIEVLDGSTELAVERFENSSHQLRVYVVHTDADQWALHFGLDAQERDTPLPDAEPALEILHTIHVAFDAAGLPSTMDPTSLSIDGFDTGAPTLSLTVDISTLQQANDMTVGVRADGLPMCQPPGAPDDAISECTRTWNTGTQRYESSQQTRRRGERSDWEQVAYAFPFFEVPAALPDPARPAPCDAPGIPIDFKTNIEGSERVVLVIDHSGSMNAKVDKKQETRRLEFAQAAARAFAARRADSAVELGLVAFNHTSGVESSLTLLSKGASLDAFSEKIDALTAEGETAIGDALVTAAGEFAGAPELADTIFLLSDGQSNSGIDLEQAKQQMVDAGVRVFTIAVGEAADKKQLAEIADFTGGQAVDVTAEELPAIYAELDATSRGHGIVFPHLKLPIGSEVLPEVELPLFVERGADELTFLASAAEEAAAWRPDIELRSPSGVAYRPGSSEVTVDPFFIQFRIRGPEAGTWRVVLQGGMGIDETVIAATIDSDEPECFVDADKKLVTAGQSVSIVPTSSYLGTIFDGVTFSALVADPNGALSSVPFSLTTTDEPSSVAASFASFHGRGTYRALVSCNVSEEARVFPGDALSDLPPNDVDVPAFARLAATSFFYDVPELPPCTNDDCDFDGIPNGDEQPGDADGDGLPNDRDDDSDGDDVPDSVEGLSDGDGDGLPASFDTDADNDGVRDGFDPPPESTGCMSDRVAPTIVASARTVSRCEPAPAPVLLEATATDSSCPRPDAIDLDVRVVSVRGKTLAQPIFVRASRQVELPVGSSVVEWTATDVNGNVATLRQTITVAVSETPAVCCAPGQQVKLGTALPNVFVELLPSNECVFGMGSVDTLVGGLLPDLLSGGDGSDVITAKSNGSTVLGGAGDDVLTIPLGGGKAYGGAGHDIIQMTGGGLVVGNAGDDHILTIGGPNVVVPGPGRDFVEAGTGQDRVHIYDLCEVAALEVLDGGPGEDTLFTPVPVSQLVASGMVVLGFEKVVVTTANRHLSECF